MPDTVPQFSAKTWRAPNLAISSIAGNKHTGGKSLSLKNDVNLKDLIIIFPHRIFEKWNQEICFINFYFVLFAFFVVKLFGCGE